MVKRLAAKLLGRSDKAQARRRQSLVHRITTLEPDLERRTDVELQELTSVFRSRLLGGQTLDNLLVEAFASIREAGKRTIGLRHFDCQLLAGIVLHQGRVAEMKNGEGKTLAATLPVYLNALAGRGVHLVTSNEYLARRDVLWMGPIYHLMGLSVGLLQPDGEQASYLYDPAYQRDPYPGLRPVSRKDAYSADVTYGTSTEFGFDYLRDNIALDLERRVQGSLYYAIVDEVDSVLVDEARTPLTISGPSDVSVEEYNRFAAVARRLEPDLHYELDEKERSVYLTDEGLAVVEEETGIENIYDEANYRYVHYMQQALKAQTLFQEGDYIPLQTVGKRQENICAFGRKLGDTSALVIVPRLLTSLVPVGTPPIAQQTWGDDRLLLPEGTPERWHNTFTGERLMASDTERGLAISDILHIFPVALLAGIQ